MIDIREDLTSGAFFGYTGNQTALVVSDHQVIKVYDDTPFGKVLVIDDVFMTSEKEEFVYHECMVHPAANMVGEVRTALVVGGGDGGIAREILRYNENCKVTIAELDSAVVETCVKHMRIDQGALNSPKVRIIYGDGLITTRRTSDQDLVVLDLTDPGTTADSLYSRDSMAIFKNSLSASGSLVMHLGAPALQMDRVTELFAIAKEQFKHVMLMGAYIPLYGSYWLMAVCSDNELVEPTIKQHRDLKYLSEQNPNLFDIPKCFKPRNNGF